MCSDNAHHVRGAVRDVIPRQHAPQTEHDVYATGRVRATERWLRGWHRRRVCHSQSGGLGLYCDTYLYLPYSILRVRATQRWLHGWHRRRVCLSQSGSCVMYCDTYMCTYSILFYESERLSAGSVVGIDAEFVTLNQVRGLGWHGGHSMSNQCMFSTRALGFF